MLCFIWIESIILLLVCFFEPCHINLFARFLSARSYSQIRKLAIEQHQRKMDSLFWTIIFINFLYNGECKLKSLRIKNCK